MVPLRAYLRASTIDDGAARSRAAFQTAYGITLHAAWAEWRAFLAARQG